MPRKSQGWITFQASAEERQILDDYCQRHQRSKTDILRQLVRGLADADGDRPLPPQASGAGLGPLALQRDVALSARNQLRVRVEALTLDGVSAELRLAAAPGLELVAIISQASAQRLGLVVGQEVYAVIKANSVMIAAIAPR